MKEFRLRFMAFKKQGLASMVSVTGHGIPLYQNFISQQYSFSKVSNVGELKCVTSSTKSRCMRATLYRLKVRNTFCTFLIGLYGRGTLSAHMKKSTLWRYCTMIGPARRWYHSSVAPLPLWSCTRIIISSRLFSLLSRLTA